MILNLISTPRNLSTALMYSFAQRTDMSVIDEPFYGHYLAMYDAAHPSKEAVLAAMPLTIPAVMSSIGKAQRNDHLFIKNMAHHIVDLSPDLFSGMVHIIFIREPKQLIASFAQVVPNPTMKDIGVADQLALCKRFMGSGDPVLVFDSSDLLANPKDALETLCCSIGLAPDPAMLSWEAGPRKEDGVWAPHWYANVHRSTGFNRQPTSSRELPENCIALYEEAKWIYADLRSIGQS